MEDDPLRRKRDFFAQLDRLEEEEDEHDPASKWADPLAAKVNFANMAKRKREEGPELGEQTPVSSATSFSSAGYGHLSRPHDSMAYSQDAPEPATPPACLRAAISNERLQNSAKSQSTSAGWTTPDISSRDKINPKTLFAGLSFYFFPPNDIDSARRFRIRKAREAGAIWIRSWSETITHVIFDSHLTYQDLLKFLKVDTLPSSIAYVNENFPAICIQNGRILDHRQFAFHVKGVPQEEDITLPSEKTDHAVPASSPALKKPKGSQKIIPSETSQSVISDQSHNVIDYSTNVLDTSNQSPDPKSESKPKENKQHPSQDDFAALVREVKATENLPLDPDEDDTIIADQDDDAAYDSDEVERNVLQSRKRKKMAANDAAWRLPAACVKNVAITTNPNKHTIEVLGEMADWYSKNQDEWRVRAYRKAIGTLKMQDKLITGKDEAAQLPFIGNRLAAKIEEIVWTGRLQRLENAKLEPTDKALQTFLQIYGVGFAQASRWVQGGHRSIQDLLDRGVKLTDNQQVGIEHYNDFLRRIPRSEVAQIGDLVNAELVSIDPGFQTIIGGSYRRGAESSGDVDILITKPGVSLNIMRDIVLDQLVPRLFDTSFLTRGLSVTSAADGTKWHGACQLSTGAHSGIWRRIDLLLVPWEEMGAALIYFTGNDIFNRSIRLRARRRGMRLNQRGLFKNILRQGIEKLTEGELLESRDERRIFEILDVPWQEPHERDRY